MAVPAKMRGDCLIPKGRTAESHYPNQPLPNQISGDTTAAIVHNEGRPGHRENHPGVVPSDTTYGDRSAAPSKRSASCDAA